MQLGGRVENLLPELTIGAGVHVDEQAPPERANTNTRIEMIDRGRAHDRDAGA